MRLHRFAAGLIAFTLSAGVVLMPQALAADDTPSLTVLSPQDGETVVNTDIPVVLQVNNFALSAANVGLPDKEGEGHVHVMLDGMTMGVLFNFYTTPSFTLPGQGIRPGKHTLIFDLASNTHMDMPDSVQRVTINYQPATAEAAPQAVTGASRPEVAVAWPPNGATVGPRFTLQVARKSFVPSLELEGKPNVTGFGHYHVFVDVDMAAMSQPGGMMSMAGMLAMPGSDAIPLDLSAWPNGMHTITVEPVQDDHTPIPGAIPAVTTINLVGAAGQ